MTPPPVDRLSPRQRECLRLVYQRKSTKEIAVALGIAPGTVSTYLTEAVQLLGARNRRHACELLAAHEGAPPPEIAGPPNQGVSASPPAAAIPDRDSTSPLRSMLPFRIKGAAGNDLDLVTRLMWIVLLAIAIAIAFGMLSVGLGVVTTLVRRAAG